eukprot:UN00434
MIKQFCQNYNSAKRGIIKNNLQYIKTFLFAGKEQRELFLQLSVVDTVWLDKIYLGPFIKDAANLAKTKMWVEESKDFTTEFFTEICLRCMANCYPGVSCRDESVIYKIGNRINHNCVPNT